MTKEFLIFDTPVGGKLMVPVEEVGCVSTLLRRDGGTDEQPEWTPDHAKSLVRVKCIGLDLPVEQSVEQIAELIEQAGWTE